MRTRTVAVLTRQADRRRPAGPDRGPHRAARRRRGFSGSWSGRAAAGSTTELTAMVQGASGRRRDPLYLRGRRARRLPRAHRRGPAVRLRPPPRLPSTPASPAPRPGGGRRAGPGADPRAARPLPAAPHRHRRRRGDAGRRPPRRGRRRRLTRRDRARVVVKGGCGQGPPLVRRPRHRRGQGGRAAGAGRGASSGTTLHLGGAVLKRPPSCSPSATATGEKCGCRRGAPAAPGRTRAWPRSGRGFAAAFRVTGWDSAARPRLHRVCGGPAAPRQAFEGTVAADPARRRRAASRAARLHHHSYRPLNVGSDARTTAAPGRTAGAVHPGATSTSPTPNWSRCWALQAAAAGRRGRPVLRHRPTTRGGAPNPSWTCSTAGTCGWRPSATLTREVPTVVLVDDHDVYHPNLWGNAGAPRPPGATTARAATCTRPPGSAWSSGSRRATTPDPHDPTPSPRASASTTAPSALQRSVVRPGRGPQVQEWRQGQPRPGRPALRPDHPRRPPGRFWPTGRPPTRAALRSTSPRPSGAACRPTSAGGPSSTPTPTPPWPPAAPPWSWSSGPGPCCSPATSTWAAWSATASTASTTARSSSSPRPPAAPWRWFEPARGSPTPAAPPTRATSPTPTSSKVLAVANPRLTKAAFRAARKGRNAELGDRRRKREGYGLVRVDKAKRRFGDRVLAVGRGSAVRGLALRAAVPEV